MKLGVVSDIHCNTEALALALQAMDDCDEVVCAGDLMLEYRWQPDVLRLLRQRGARTIAGNHDVGLLALVEAGRLSNDSILALRDLPRSLHMEIGGRRIAVYHGSPWDRQEAGRFNYLFESDRPALNRAVASDVDFLILGHTHVPMNVKVGRTRIVNPGSCGEPGRKERVRTCATIDLSSGEVSFHALSL